MTDTTLKTMQKNLQAILLCGALAILAAPHPTLASGGRDNNDDARQQNNSQTTSVTTGNNSQQQSNNQNTNVTTGNNSQQQSNNQENNQSNNQNNEQSNSQSTNITTGGNVNTVNNTTNVSAGGATNSLSTGPVSNSNTNNTGAVSNSNTNNYISYPDWINVAPSQSAVSVDSVTCQGPTLTATASTLTTDTYSNQYGIQGAFGFSVPLGGQADCNAVQAAIRKRAVVENSVRVALACKQLESSGIEVDVNKFPDLAICSAK